jgi:hypothetical protein
MPKIDKVEFGEIVVSGKSYYSDVTIRSNGSVEHMRKKHRLGVDEVLPAIKDADCLVIGTGMKGSVSVAEEVSEILEDKKIRLFVDETPNAVDIFNGLLADRKRVAGIFHVTS